MPDLTDPSQPKRALRGAAHDPAGRRRGRRPDRQATAPASATIRAVGEPGSNESALVVGLAPGRGAELPAPHLVGDKAHRLARLSGLGLEVPEGFVVTPHVLQAFLQEHGIDAAAPAGLSIAPAIAQSTLPYPLAHAVRSAYAQLSLDVVGGLGDAPVALRPSPVTPTPPNTPAAVANPTDRPHAARLNVRGADAVVQQLQQLWAETLATQQGSIGPRNDVAGTGLAVAVQRFLDCESAGIVLPQGPEGDRNEVQVLSSWGHGPRLLGRQAPPTATATDRFVLDKDSGGLLRRTVAAKGVQLAVADNGGCELRPVAAHRAGAPSLTDEEASRLAEASRIAEQAFGAPHELEFAVVWRGSNRRLQLLQARPLVSTSPTTA